MCISPVFRLAALRVSAWVMMAMRASSFPFRSETASGYAFPAYSPWSADWLVVQKLGPIREYWMTPPLPNGAERNLLTGDATAQIPFITAAAKELLDNLNALTNSVQGQGGALGVLMGNAGDRQRVMDGVQNANSLLTRLESVATHADKTVLGQSGLVPQATALVNETTATVAQARGTLTQVSGALAQLSGTLTQVSGSLTRVDGILKDVKGVSASANEASVDLVALRSEVDQGLREVNALLASLQGKWPFESTQPSIQLP